MNNISKHDIKQIVMSAFELVLEDVEDAVGYEYNDMTSKQQEKFILEAKSEFVRLCDDELNNIKKNWTEDSAEVKQLKNRIKELERQIYVDNHSWSEDMGS